MQIGELSTSTTDQLRNILLLATAEKSCRWEKLTDVCVLTMIGDYGIFLTRYQDVTLTSIYYKNVARLEDIPRRGLRQLFNSAVAQADWRRRLTRGEVIAFNLGAAERKRRAENLQLDIYRLFSPL